MSVNTDILNDFAKDYKKFAKTSDAVNHPEHYTSGGIECIDAIKASMTHDEFIGYLKGNIIKYIWRYKRKNNPAEDLQKCKWYLNKLIETYDEVNKHAGS